MSSENDIQQKVNAAMESIDKLQRAEMPPFFYTRLVARMESQGPLNAWQQLFSVVTTPLFSVVTLSLFAVINIVAINAGHSETQQPAIKQSATLQGFSEEYNLSVNTIYQ